MSQLFYTILSLHASTQIPANSLGIPAVPANDATLKTILSMVFVFMGAWATLFILIGSFRYIISSGNQNQIKQAKDTILYAAIGLAVSVLAFTIVQFVLGKVG